MLKNFNNDFVDNMQYSFKERKFVKLEKYMHNDFNICIVTSSHELC